MCSNTDAKLIEFKSRMETNGKEPTADDGDEDIEKPDSSKKPPCEWKFFSEKDQDGSNFKTGYRVQLTHHKVF